MFTRAFAQTCAYVRRGLCYARDLAETRCPACYKPIVTDRLKPARGTAIYQADLRSKAKGPHSPASPADQKPPPDPAAKTWQPYGLCPECAVQLAPYTGAHCPLCGLPHVDSTGPAVPCAHCLAKAPLWSAIAFHALYAGTLQGLLLRLKYHADFALIPVLGSMLWQAAASLPPCDVLLSMPQYPSHLRARGFNQAHELAKFVARVIHLPLNTAMLVRTRQPLSQTRLKVQERWDNPKQSFAAHGVQGLRILLIDDTMTTGATLHHATLALLEQGASSVAVAVVARTAPPSMIQA